MSVCVCACKQWRLHESMGSKTLLKWAQLHVWCALATRFERKKEKRNHHSLVCTSLDSFLLETETGTFQPTEDDEREEEVKKTIFALKTEIDTVVRIRFRAELVFFAIASVERIKVDAYAFNIRRFFIRFLHLHQCSAAHIYLLEIPQSVKYSRTK